MKPVYHKILLDPGESFTCKEWNVAASRPEIVVRDVYLIIMMMKGCRGMRVVGDSLERLPDGDIVLLAPGIPTYWLPDAGDNSYRGHISVSFDEAFLDGAPFRSPEGAPLRHLISRARRGLAFSPQVYAKVHPPLLRAARLKGWERLCLFLDVLGYLAASSEARPLTSEKFSSELDMRDAGRLSEVCHYVHSSYRGEIREKEAAAIAGLSPVGFSRFFHRRIGMTFMGYVTDLRINEACRKLSEEDSPIVEIALETGFNTLSNFNRHFRRLKGITPREYRRLHPTQEAAPAPP